MITGDLKSRIDRIWDTMWSGGISNPLSVIEQLTYLLFIKRLDELRWSRFRETAPERMFETMRDLVFPFIKTLGYRGQADELEEEKYSLGRVELEQMLGA